ncbi:hypothetical protein LRS05_00010 [Flavobacterium sp. J372]|uniref:hypothetical protein n=1 Tax=Flavobacterium sp. J372 TaxID=2898436 RepID=UPI002150D0CB|nr:hypothetical protein [Flavobacterium sp. J372]MCR5860645.1 hypothetical protein [Flavobacterium sp. J372]
MAITFYDFAFCSTDAGFSRKVQILLSPRNGLKYGKTSFSKFSKKPQKKWKTCKIQGFAGFFISCTLPDFFKRQQKFCGKIVAHLPDKKSATELHVKPCISTSKTG